MAIILNYVSISPGVFNHSIILDLFNKALNSENWDIKSTTAKTLSCLQSLPESILDMLVNCLKNNGIEDKDKHKNIKSFTSKDLTVDLGKKENLSKSILEKLVRCLRDKDEKIRDAALGVLMCQTSFPKKFQ